MYLHRPHISNIRELIRRSTSFGALAPQSECVDVSKLFFPMLTSKVVMTTIYFVTPPIFGNDRHVKFLAVALHSHLNNGPDCCHRFVERPFMAEKKTPLNNYSLRGKNVQTLKPLLRSYLPRLQLAFRRNSNVVASL